MKQIQPDLWQTEVESPFPGLTTHAYLLTRDDGNLLFYNTGHLDDIDRMAELGDLRYQFLSHLDELGDSLNVIHERFGTRLGGHVREREAFARVREPDILFDKHETLLGNVEVIPTPGHTPGSTCFWVRSPHGKGYLFTGDTLYHAGGDTWKPGLLPGSDRDALIASLERLRQLAPDVVLSSACAEEPGFEIIEEGGWAARVDRALAALRDEDG